MDTLKPLMSYQLLVEVDGIDVVKGMPRPKR